MQKHNFIFLGGLHRSGTWLQTHCLEEHPQISRLGTVSDKVEARNVAKMEGQFLQTVYPADEYYGGVGRLGFHPQVHLTEKSPLVTETNRVKLFSEWSRYWDTSKSCLLEKTPANLVRSRFLQAMFPDSYFIFVIRHPVAVALAQQKWSGTSVSSLIEHWLVCHEIMLEDVRHLKKVIYFRYEDFIKNPEAQLNRSYAFLGLEPTGHTQQVRTDGNDKYFKIWQHALETNDNAENLTLARKLRNRLMPYLLQMGHPLTILANEARTVVMRYEARVNRFGYSLIDPPKTTEFSIST
jgi:hypothetical protein